jgi:hypothetical protein
MTKIAITPNAAGTGTFTIAAPNSNSNRTLNLPDAAGTVLAGGTPSSSTTNSVTTKIPVVIGGVTYYLLASTDGT